VTEKGQAAMRVTVGRSTDLCAKVYADERFDPAATAERLRLRFGPKSHQVDARQMRCLQALCAWRDRLARTLDESCHYVSPDACLWRIAVAMPTTSWRLRSTCNPLPNMLQDRAQEVVDMIIQSQNETASAPNSPAADLPSNAAHRTGPASGRAQLGEERVAASAVGAATTVDSPKAATEPLVLTLQEWPKRRQASVRPLVHVNAACGGPSVLLQKRGSVGALLSTLAFLEVEDISMPTTPARIDPKPLEKLKSIEGAMTFTAVPPTKPDITEFQAEEDPEAVRVPVVVNVEDTPVDADALESCTLRHRKRKKNASTACLEKVVQAVASDPYEVAFSDPYALEVEAPATQQRKKKRLKKPQRTDSDPYL